MSTRRLFVPVALGIAMAIVVLGTLSTGRPQVTAAPAADTRYVATTGDDADNDCTLQAAPCRTIQHAVDEATSGDAIEVAAGTYTEIHRRSGLTQVVYISKSVTIRGGYAANFAEPPDPEANRTTLDARGQGRALYVSGDITTTVEIEGLRITGGDATDLGGGAYGDDVGGGVYVRGATTAISHCAIYSNTADDTGGGLHLYRSDNATLSQNTIRDNAARYGGGLALEENNTTLSENIISSNTAEDAGGGLLTFGGNATLNENTIMSNAAGWGGGLHLSAGEVTTMHVTLRGNTVSSNTAEQEGGGLSLQDCRGKLDRNTFTGNTAEGAGGGLYLTWSDDTTLDGNTIKDNTAGSDGGGLSLWGVDATLIGNTLSGNTAGWNGGGLYADNEPGGTVTALSNTIIANTASWGGGLYLTYCMDPTISGNTFQGNVAEERGGGLYVGWGADATVTGNTISSNHAGLDGGGLYLSPGFFSGAIARANVIEDNTAGQDGGGVMVMESAVSLAENTIAGNAAGQDCGGVALDVGPGSSLARNTISANSAGGAGGGLCMRWNDATLVNNVIADNEAGTSGAGLSVAWSNPRLAHTTIARNVGGDGSGLSVKEGSTPSMVSLTNTILVSHTVGITVAAGNTVTLDATLWGGGGGWSNETEWSGAGTLITGTTNVWDDPAFVDAHGGDYHITGASAARDAGVDAGVTDDVDNQFRPMGSSHDIGADEYPGPALDIIKQPSGAFLNRGANVAYTIVVASAGTEDATGVVLTDTLDSLQRPTSVASSAGSCSISEAGWGGAVACTLGMLEPGARVTITLTAQISSTAELGQPIVNTAVVKGNEAEGNIQVTNTVQDCHARVNDGLTAYATVQAAVDAAEPGDLVKVAGVCLGVNERGELRQQVHLTKSLTLRGGYTTTDWTTPDPGANATVLDALGQGRVLYIVGDITATVEGLQITGGDDMGLGGCPWSGQTCGSGVYAKTASVRLLSNHIINNVSTDPTQDNGGGIFLWSVGPGSVVSDSQIVSNTAQWGGGVFLYRSGNASLIANAVRSNSSSRDGGGVFLDNSDGTTLSRNTIKLNTADNDGGGIDLYDSSATLTNNVIADNQSDDKGSGLYVEDSYLRLLHTTIARNPGTGVYVADGSVAMTNTILVSHTVGVHVAGGESAVMDATLWGAGAWANETDWSGGGSISTGSVNVRDDPGFVDPKAGDYHIGPSSAALDAGVDAAVGLDIDGEPRPVGTGYDIGADEFAAALAVTKHAHPDPVAAGQPLTYTIRVTNTGTVDLHATVTDTLPAHVTPSGVRTWRRQTIAAGDVWIDTVAVTVEMGYTGLLTNTVRVGTDEGASGTHTTVSQAEVIFNYVHLPVVLRGH